MYYNLTLLIVLIAQCMDVLRMLQAISWTWRNMSCIRRFIIKYKRNTSITLVRTDHKKIRPTQRVGRMGPHGECGLHDRINLLNNKSIQSSSSTSAPSKDLGTGVCSMAGSFFPNLTSNQSASSLLILRIEAILTLS